MNTTLTVTEIALEKFVTALSDEEKGTGVRVACQQLGPASFHYELEIVTPSNKNKDDIEIIKESVAFWIDPHTAKLVSGTTIDYQVTDTTEGFKFANPNDPRYKKWEDPIAVKFQAFLESDINPGIASHGGVITLLEYQHGVATIYMGGGCQGCGQAGATLREGVEKQVKERIPEIIKIVDITDHDSGLNPYY